jgi:hypothetical protein
MSEQSFLLTMQVTSSHPAREIEAYRYGNVTEVSNDGETIVWRVNGYYSAETQRERLLSGWIGAMIEEVAN